MIHGLSGVVLAGGSAQRLSGLDKPALRIGGVSLLRRAVDALSGARPVVVVGPRRDGFPDVLWTREAEPGAGPVAALAAGLAVLGEETSGENRDALVALLAADLIGITRSTVDRLSTAVGTADGAVLIDAEGRRQWLIGVWRAASLRGALPDDPAGASLGRTLGALIIVDVPEKPGESVDIDTGEDLDRFR